MSFKNNISRLIGANNFYNNLEIGEILNDDFASFSNYTENLPNSVRTGKSIVTTGTNVTNYITYQFGLNSENYTQVVTGTIDNTSARIGIYFNSLVNSNNMYSVIWNPSTNKFEYRKTTTIEAEISKALTLSAGLPFTLTYKRFGTSFTITLTHNNTTISWTLDMLTTSSYAIPNFREVGVACFGGAFTLSTHSITLHDNVNSQFIFLMDSIGSGLNVTTESNRFFNIEKLDKSGMNFSNLSGRGNKLQSVNFDELDLYDKNATIYIELGTNNYQDTTVDFTNNYQDLIDGLLALGFTKIIKQSLFPRAIAPITTLNNAIESDVDGGTFADIYSYFSTDGTTNTLKAEFDSGDGTHLTDAGNAEWALRIEL